MNRKISQKYEMKLLILILVAVILVISFFEIADAIGITPGRTTLDFEPGLQKTITLKVLNNELKVMKVELAVSGELAKYVQLEQNVIEFKEYESEKEIRYNVKLPETTDKPGVYTARIIAIEVPKEAQAKGTNEVTSQVTSVIGVASQLYVKVPYAGPYIDANIQVTQELGKEGENFLTFLIQMNNLGLQDTKALTDLVILKDNNVVANIKTEEKNIGGEQGAELIADWQTKETGNYVVQATISYSGKKITLQKAFKIGRADLVLKKIYVENYKAEQIAKVSIVVENMWTEPLKNVYGHLIITTDKGDVVSEFKSASIDLDAGDLETIYAYWDTKGIGLGSYTAKIVMHYNDQSFEREIKTRVNKDSIDFEIVGITAEVIATKSKSSSVNNILIGFIILLVLGNILWFVYFRKRKLHVKANR